MNITIPTINAALGKFNNNYQKIKEALAGVSCLSDDYLIIHPYSLMGASALGRVADGSAARLLQGVQEHLTSNSITLIWERGNWSLYVKKNDKSYSLQEHGYVTYEDLHFTTDAILHRSLDDIAKVEAKLWIIYLMQPYSKEGVLEQIRLAQELYQHSGIPLLLVGALGVANDLLFAGDLALFHGDTWGYAFALDNQATRITFTGEYFDIEWQKGALLLDFLKGEFYHQYHFILFALKEFVMKSGFSKVHLGLSGGVDSALVATLAVQALGRENVVGILMPSPHSSTHSVDDALALAQNLGIETKMIPIDEPYQLLGELLSTHFAVSTLADENMQARLRGLYLMTYANSSGSFLLTTGNKSEIACGYGTLYGDMCGSYNPIGDLYKTEVYAMCALINQEAGYAVIPEHIITKAPSAELREGQYDQESLPPYERLDKIIELLLSTQEDYISIAEQVGSVEVEVRKVASLLRKSEFKRWQAPPVLKLTRSHLGSSRSVDLL